MSKDTPSTPDREREALVEKLNRLVAKSHGLPVDDLPPNVGLLSPNIDVQRLADELLSDRKARETAARIDALKITHGHLQTGTNIDDDYFVHNITKLEAQLSHKTNGGLDA